MRKIFKEKLGVYQAKSFRLTPNLRLNSIIDAEYFVKERGFVYLWPIKGVTLPSLWTAVTGNSSVANSHDDPGHITWGWKDDALGKRIWYYGKILRKKATMIDLEIAPYFYALSKNYGNPEEDVFIQYHEGHLTLEAKAIFENLLVHGPMDTIALRRKTQMISNDSSSRFDRALTLLQSDFKVLPIGISDAGAWRYAFIYDLTHRHYPEILEKARYIKEQDSRQKLIGLYFGSVGVARLRDVMKLFGWNKNETESSLQSLVDKGFLLDQLEVESEAGTWYALPSLR